MSYPNNLRYTDDHEWVLPEGEAWSIGITDFAQKQLGDVVFVSVGRKVGDKIERGHELGTIESVKAVSELYAPISGTIVEINAELDSEPELLNTNPYAEGWIVKIKPSNTEERDELKDAAAYEKLLASEQG